LADTPNASDVEDIGDKDPEKLATSYCPDRPNRFLDVMVTSRHSVHLSGEILPA